MKISVNDVTLFYEKVGDGDNVFVLLHGNGEDHHVFDPLVSSLKAHGTVYGLDSRGHGQSSSVSEYCYKSMMEDVYQVIQTLELGQVNVIGFSDGGIIGLLLAIHHPDVVKKAAFLGANLSPDDLSADAHNYLTHAYELQGDPLIKLMLDEPAISPKEVAALSMPVLFAFGENDIFKPSLAEKLKTAQPKGVFLALKGHDHDSYINGTDILYPALSDFFK